jgi:hypothetical protein
MALYVHNDEAPFGVPSGVNVHDTITVTNSATTLGTATGSAGVPTVTDVNGTRYPKAVYLGTANSGHDVWVTWDGQTPAVGTSTPLGVKVPPTYPALRIPFPSAIKADAIKIISDQVAGAPVIMVWEF